MDGLGIPLQGYDRDCCVDHGDDPGDRGGIAGSI